MSITAWIALVVVVAVVWALIKRWETRMVLIASGLFLCIISWDFLSGLNSMANSMVNKSLVQAICASMGFAFAAKYTRCDSSLVHYLASPIRGLGIFLLPVCTVITFFVNIAIPSAAGCAAAVGSTLIPVMLRAGIKPAAAAAAVLGGTIGSYLSPGTSHNPYVANMAGMDVMTFIGTHATYSVMIGVISAVGILIVCFFMGDHKGDKNATVDESKLKKEDADFVPNPIAALVPLVPITLLLVGNLWVEEIKMGVAPAMTIGAICALAVARVNPQTFTKEFFNGMGKGYADVMGIIIAAGVFAAGLKSAGLIGIITGSGDAATLAFNETVTPHAKDFGMTIEGLGGLAFLAGAAGRTASPIAGVTILVSGIAMVSPIEVVKRTVLPMTISVILCAILMV